MNNPFKKIAHNSEASKNEDQWKDERLESGMDARVCENCGAPRSARKDLRTCTHCGFQFMNLDSARYSERD